MFGFIKGLFSSKPDNVMEIARGVGGWIDEQQFTEEEKSKAAFQMLEYQLKWLNATQGMNVARRYLAILFCSAFVFTFLFCLVGTVAGFYFNVDVDPLIKMITDLVDSFQIGWVTITIVVFYFGKGIAENAFKKQ